MKKLTGRKDWTEGERGNGVEEMDGIGRDGGLDFKKGGAKAGREGCF